MPVASCQHLHLALLEGDLLLGQEVVGVGPIELPDLVEDRELDLGVETHVSDQFPGSGPVLLLDMGPRRSCCRAVTG